MKPTKILMGAVACGVMILATNIASAFPLKLTSENGTMNITGYYGPTNDPTITSNKIASGSYNLKKVLMCITNEIQLRGSSTPLAYNLMYDPYLDICYLTNAGWSYVLSTQDFSTNDIAHVFLSDVVTSFSGNASGSESDRLTVELWVHNVRPPGNTYTAEFDAIGGGTLTESENKTTGVAKMTISEKGNGYAALNNSDEGVLTTSSFSFTGSGTVAAGQLPFSIYWWNNIQD